MIGVGVFPLSLFSVELRLGDRWSASTKEIEKGSRAAPTAPAPVSVTPPVRNIINGGFDPDYYLRAYPDVRKASMEPWAHYDNFGRDERRNPNALFDAVGYLATYSDIAEARVDPFQHYMEIGWREGRNPSRFFNTLAYLAAYPDVLVAGINPLEHFLIWGWREGRSPNGIFTPPSPPAPP